jgi:glucose/arabinose dehydrogenase
MRAPLVLAVAALTVLGASSTRRRVRDACPASDAGITVPAGFCATVFADRVGSARHLAVAPNGDVLVAVADARTSSTSHVARLTPEHAAAAIVTLRDTNGDGRADVELRAALPAGTGIALWRGYVYFTNQTQVLRVPWRDGRLDASHVDTIVFDVPGPPGHASKSVAIDDDGDLYVSVGSATNACRVTRNETAPDPCPELAVRSGIWRYRADRTRQRHPADGERFATGIRNAVALAWSADQRALYALSHGRDGLYQIFPQLFTRADGAEKPAEEMFRVRRGDDYGWPYCFYDPIARRKVLAPEYGGDGRALGRCAEKSQPILAFPGHWAPDGVLLYTGTSFPARYRGGAFVAFHGSWNRLPLPEQGYDVVFAPFADGRPTGAYEVFASGFAGDSLEPVIAEHRPTGLAQGPHGELYVSDDQRGRIYRITYGGRY